VKPYGEILWRNSTRGCTDVYKFLCFFHSKVDIYLSFFLHSEIHESSSRRVLLEAEQDSTAQHDQYLSGSSGVSGSSLALQRLPAAKGFIEMIYTFWYKDKSDAWRLFHSLAPRLDGRAWPERKRQQVRT
jgi:hypothetical protein